MNTTEMDRIIVRVMAAWSPLEPSTREVWREHLAPMDYPMALKAVQSLELSSQRRPAIADLHVAYRSERSRNTGRRLEPVKEYAADSDVRYAALTGWLKQPREPITEKMLNEAGIPHWRERLESAVADDRERGTHRRCFDETWAQIRTELGRKPLVLPDGSTFGA